MLDRAHVTLGHAELFRDLPRLLDSDEISHLPNALVGNEAISDPASDCCIASVFGWRSNPKVMGVDARGVVARVQDVKATRDGNARKLKRDPMRPAPDSTAPDDSVSAFVPVPGPFPTLGVTQAVRRVSLHRILKRGRVDSLIPVDPAVLHFPHVVRVAQPSGHDLPHATIEKAGSSFGSHTTRIVEVPVYSSLGVR